MKRPEIFRNIGRFRKRKFFIFLSVVVVIFFMALLLLISTGLFGIRSGLVSVRLSDQASVLRSFDGCGVNLDDIPVTNLVRNASFETNTDYCKFSIADASSNYVYLDTEELSDSGAVDDSLIGSNIRIVSLDEQGDMADRFEGSITGYDRAKLGTFTEITDDNYYWTRDSIVKTCYVSSTVVGLTESGQLISDITAGALSKTINKDDEVFADVSSSSQGVAAVTTTGVFYVSADGRTFSQVSDGSSEIGSESIVGLSYLNGTPIAALSDGSLLIGSGSVSYLQKDVFSNSLTAFCSNGTDVIAILSDKSVLSSQNGLVFSKRENVVFDAGVSAISVCPYSDGFALLLSDNRVIRLKDNDQGDFTVKNYDALNGAVNDAVSLTVTDSGEILLTDEIGTAYIVYSNGTASEISADTEGADLIFNGPNGKVIAQKDGILYMTSVYAGIQTDSEIGDDAIMAGDILYIEKTTVPTDMSMIDDNSWQLSQNGGGWDLYGEGTSSSIISDSAIGCGSSCIRVSGLSDGIHMLSQSLNGAGSDLFIEGEFYRIELELKQDGITDGNVNVWLSGDGFQSQGTNLNGVSGKFDKYTYVFAIPEKMALSSDSVRLNISFEGNGKLYVDGVYVGLDKYEASCVPDMLTTSLAEAAPSAVRLNNLAIGQNGYGDSSLYSMPENSTSYIPLNQDEIVNSGVISCSSIEASLRLVKSCNANPWLVIGSCCGQDDTKALLEYLCGSVNSKYGKARIDNGTAVPWDRQFSTIYIEINDDSGVFSSDIQKSAYVNYIINQIRQSDYYVELKDKLVFLDGMNYDGGTMLSGADYHCSSLDISHVVDSSISTNSTFIDDARTSYEDFNYSLPRVASHGNETGEYVSSLSVNSTSYNSTDLIVSYSANKMTAGQYLAALFADTTGFSRMVMLDLDISSKPSNYESEQLFSSDYISNANREISANNNVTAFNVINSIGLLSFSDRLECTLEEPLDSSSGYSVETFSQDVGTYLFRSDDKVYLVIANASGSQQQFLAEGTDVSMDGAILRRYSDEGELLITKKIGNSSVRYTLQAGEYMIIEANVHD